ncbi:MAG: DUF268 domain-containing protein [Cytophagaceae bacterium]|nr:DUF268 domain-containing protein [Cytophagaceae bacterium]
MQIKNIALLPSLIIDYLKLVNQLKSNPDFKITKLFPILSDKKDSGGLISGHYFHQDLLVAQKIFISNPEKHVDIASRVDGFVAHVAVFREIEIFDIRPINSKVRNIKFVLADLMDQGSAYENYCDSISCLHAIEHFGLGRYNDPIDADGHLKGLKSIFKILKSGGRFYFSTPIGPQRIEFNAHRVFSLHYLLELFKDDYELMSFSYVDDAGDLHENQTLTDQHIKSNFNCHYGCGIFELKKN